jgi:hypothetical protein
MNELLSNPAVQTALIAVIVIGLQALVTWLKQKFPTQAASVEANWCYLQPVVEVAMNRAREIVSNQTGTTSMYSAVIAQAVTQFADSYRKLEGKGPTSKELDAAQAEIATAVSRVTTGG